MPLTSHRFIDPRALAAISRLHLLAKTVVDGFMLGVQHSRHIGPGLEFNQYRSYEPGDDPRRVDWKLYARSDRYYVRESEVETSIAIRFVLDATASMAHEEDGFSKFDYARFLVASLAYLAYEQGDAIGLNVVGEDAAIDLPARHFSQHLHRFLYELEELEPGGVWPAQDRLMPMMSGESRRSVIVFVTDMHEVDDEILQTLAKIRTLKHEVIVFHLLGAHEAAFSYQGQVTFEDLETGRRLACDADSARSAYLEAQSRALDTLNHTLRDRDIAYERLTMDQPLDVALRQYLQRRSRMTC